MKRQNKGFTLIELMVTVAIVAILAAIAIPSFNAYQLRSKQSEATTNIGGIKTAVEAFAGNYDSYPPDIAANGGTLTPQKQPFPATPCPTTCSAQNVADCDEFTCVGWLPSGYVYYQYGVQEGDTPGVGNAIFANADLDGDAALSAFMLITDVGSDGADVTTTGAAVPCAGAVTNPTILTDCAPSVY